MRFVLKFLFSNGFTTVLLFVFAYLIGVATFIENEYNTTTANIEIFRSKWLELIMVLLAINFLGNIKRYNLISLKKWPTLTFHLAFVVIIAGAGITRYFGFEGIMPIREGQTSGIIYSGEPHLQFKVLDPKMDPKNPRSALGYSEPHLMAATTDNDFEIEFDMEKAKVQFTYLDYIENSDYKLYEGVKDGGDILEVVTTIGGVRQSFYLEKGHTERIGSALISYNDPSSKAALAVVENENGFSVISPIQIPRRRMRDQMLDTLFPGVGAKMDFVQLHQVRDASIVFKRKIENGIKRLESTEHETQLGHALKVKIQIDSLETERTLFGGPGKLGVSDRFEFGGMYFNASYGSIPIELPFQIKLEDFIMETYPGSTNPSGYKSKVTLIDTADALVESHEIFMNNVLDYKGYRFFQSSFDKDQKGTVLSVNHDFVGTWVSYIGYLLLGLGFVLTLFNKNSRFFGLSKKVKDLRNKREKLVVLILALSFTGLTQAPAHDPNDGQDHSGHDHSQHDHSEHAHQGAPEDDLNSRSGRSKVAKAPKLISIEHADKFGQLIVQSAGGRYEPVNTLAFDLVHKLTKGNEVVVGDVVFTPEQFLLELLINGTYFEDKRIIKVRDDSVRHFLGVMEGKYVSFLDFIQEGKYSKLREPLMAALGKDPKKRNRWDKEIIKVGDKLESFNQAQAGYLLRIFPSMDETENNKWVSYRDKEAMMPLKDLLNGKYNTEGLPVEASYASIIGSYLGNLSVGKTESAEIYLDALMSLQRKLMPDGVIPSVEKAQMETDYNKSSIFANIQKWYSYLAVFLLILSLSEALVSKRDTGVFKYVLQYPLWFFTGLFALVFAYHTYGLATRWYLTGHAPWSNGYEALVFIAWGTALSGLLFSRLSKITVAGTALVSFLILMTASHENMDPQMTDLVPVLKSYWLIIHVACITTSYAFFGLGAILGLIVMGVMLFKGKDNYKRINMLTSELTFINEMTVTIGLILAAVGTFLGGVWANESWGRYWGWDAKETWALIIVIVYSMLLHFRFVPGFIRTKVFFNAFGTVAGFGTVCMTFFGVNFYFSKSVHSYAAGDPPAFPIWLWVTILSILTLCVVASIKEVRSDKKKLD